MILKSQLIYELDNRPTRECHASTIAETKTGLIAAWFGGVGEGHPSVGIWTLPQRRIRLVKACRSDQWGEIGSAGSEPAGTPSCFSPKTAR